ncbi:hypothetical protein [Pedobacter borealis]|uniref:hypothetical protein n=1 Tax=Pedobacter borealis TaxID=475254 RepID=UPI0004935F07|nr:hypothetical protein [Pedobacter borealis]
MRFTKQGYLPEFIQKRQSNDGSAHLFTLIYKFYSPVTHYIYIIHADYHQEDVFAIKFYAKPHRQSEYKYSKLTNKGDVSNILTTCLNVIPLILVDYPEASFGFIGSRTIDTASRTVEDYRNTQRFRVYKEMVEQKIGHVTFQHFTYEQISGYLLVNRSTANIQSKERLLVKMFDATYNNLLEL